MRNRTIRADIPEDVWQRFAEEAQQRGVPMGRHLRNLIVARDAKRQSVSRNQGASPSTTDKE